MNAIPQKSSGWRSLPGLWRTRYVSFVVTGCVVMLLGFYVTVAAVPNVYEAGMVLILGAAGRPAGALGGRDFRSEIMNAAVLTAAAEAAGKLPADASPTARQAVASDLAKGLQVLVQQLPAGGTEIQLVNRGHDRKEVAEIVNRVAEAYVADGRKKRGLESEKAERLGREASQLAGNSSKARGETAAAEAALGKFESENADALGAPGGDPDALLARLTEEQRQNAATLDKTQAEVAGLEAAGKLLLTRLESVPEFIETKEVTTVPDPERVSLEHEIRTMERQLEEMLKTYTYKHPEVIQMQTNLLLKRRQLRELKERVQDSVKSSRTQNPEYGVLKGKLDDTVVKLQVTRSSLAQLSGRQEALDKRLGALRAVAGSYRKLKGDLAAAQSRQQEQEAALAAKKKELDAATAAIEPVCEIHSRASTPMAPVGPRRSLYSLAVLIVSALAALAAMSLASRLGTGFAGEFELDRLAGVPVAGSIGAVAGTPADRRQRARNRTRFFLALAFAALTVMAAAVMLANSA